LSVYTILLTLHLASAVALLALLVLALRNHTEPAAPWLAGVCACMLLWVGAYTCELAVARLDDKLIWADLQFVAATALPLLWLVAVRLAVGRPMPPRWLLAVLAVVGLVIIAGVYANPGGLFRGEPTLDLSGPIPFVDADYGPLYYVGWLLFASGLLTATVLTLGSVLVHGPRTLRARSMLLLAGTALPIVSGLLFIGGVLPWPNFNPTMAVVSVATVVVACALVYGRLFSVAPLARGRVVEQLADGVIICDAHGRVSDCNPAARRVLPELRCARGRLLTDALAGRVELLEAFDAARDEARVKAEVKADVNAPETSLELLEHGVGSVQIWSGGGPGPTQRRHLSVVTTPVYSRLGRLRGEAIVLRDVTGSVEVLQRLRRIATTDELTGLLARRQLLELGRREVDRAQRLGGTLAVVIFDVDGLKAINDTYGHLAGDEVLRLIGAVARSELRSFDLLGRYGGDEFAGVLPDLGPQEALAVAERLRLAVATMAVWHEEVCLRTTVSVGVACGSAGESLTELIAAADEALYEAKEGGRDRVVAAVAVGG
jgi:diguanylate cyclase (GGDEF)-like protein